MPFSNEEVPSNITEDKENILVPLILETFEVHHIHT
jgi:hypothetical protein